MKTGREIFKEDSAAAAVAAAAVKWLQSCPTL